MANKGHLNDQLLESALDKGLAPERFEEILRHLSACPRCEQRMEQMESALASYLHFRNHVALMFPQPSKPWSNIWAEMERVTPAPLKRKSPTRPVWVGAMAAVAAALVLFWPRPDSSLHAETLLQKSKVAMAHSPAQARRRLSVRTQAGSFIRPAVLATSSVADNFAGRVGAEFGSADYNWNDPLNPAAFAEWRDSRRHKTDVVLVRPSPRTKAVNEYIIRTTTAEGELREASLTIESPAMLPVGARFVFANSDWIEISELPEVTPPSEPTLIASTLRSPLPSLPKTDMGDPVPVEIILASRELQVRAAIDALNLPPGEPIAIEPDDRNQIVITAYALSVQDLNRLRASIQAMEGVTMRVEEATPKTVAETDPLIDASESVAAQAHLVSQIAERFPQAMAARLNPEDRRILWKLRERQTGELNRKVDQLYQQLGKPVPDTKALEGDSTADMLRSAITVNRLVTSIYAGGSTHRDSGTELSLELSRLKQLAQAYSNYVARSLETLP